MEKQVKLEVNLLISALTWCKYGDRKSVARTDNTQFTHSLYVFL